MPAALKTHLQQYVEVLSRFIRQDVETGRLSTHLAVIVLIVLALCLSRVDLSWGQTQAIHPLKQPVAAPAATVTAQEDSAPPLALVSASLQRGSDDVLVRGAAPHTLIPNRTKAEIKTYVVQFGDTISDIALKFGITPETIMWANSTLGDNPDLLRVGQELTILPVNGVYHQVGEKDTFESIAATFKADPAAIIAYPLNKIDPENPIIQSGQWLVVPNGTKPYIPRKVTAYSGPVPEDATKGTGIFGWPTTGSITQDYWASHRGIDIGGWVGAPIAASDSGHVVAAGWDNTGYGNLVVIDHSNGFQTLYGHLSSFTVKVGDNVAKGQIIGEMGTTGNSTGPHLHFEIRQGTVQRNPYGFLP
jgi:murein DD-endopeptidase MepM/ murein hydrolase activator NlpD